MMKLKKMLKAARSQTSVCEISRPTIYRPEKGNGRALLLIHGFTGSPHDMHYLAQRCRDAGYLVSVPRLPGHGTDREDFLSSDAEDWFRRCLDAWYELRSSRLPSYIGGLSMGGVLAAILAAACNPRGLILAAPAFRANNPLLPFTPVLRLFVKERRKRSVQDFSDPKLNYLAEEYWNALYPSAAAELLRLQRLAKKQLSAIDCPVLSILSENDKAVPITVSGLIKKQIPSKDQEELRLKESPHVVVNDCEKERVAETILDWLHRKGQS